MTTSIRAFLVASFMLLGIGKGNAQGVTVRVDPRVELLSWVFRLAGRSEYNTTRVPRWQAAIDSQLAPLAAHEAVAMSKRLGFGFFIPMNLAIHLTEPPALRERSPFSASKSLHRRWLMFPDSTSRYVGLLRAFAAESKIGELFTRQAPLIDTARVRLQRVTESVDQAWLTRYFGGTSPVDFVLVAAMTSGGASYGQSWMPDAGRGEAYAIIGVSRVDAAGFPLFDAEDMPTVLHEMTHPFVTSLLASNADSFRAFGDSLFATVATPMRQQSYGSWDAMINESIVRAVVIRYLLAHDQADAAERTILDEVAHGFVWTRELVQLLGDYERNRAAHPTMAEFMPRVVELFRRWPRTIR